MSDYDVIVVSILVVWTIYQGIISFIGPKKNQFRILVSLVFITAYAVLKYDSQLYTAYFEYYFYILLAIFSLSMIFGNIWKYFKKDISEFDFLQLEDELDDLNNDFEVLRKRFISTIELLNDGIAFRDFEGNIFGSDRFIEFYGLKNNEFSLDSLYEKIYKDDLPQYKLAIEKTNKKNPIYSMNYRIIHDDNLLWVKEIGKRIVIAKKISYIALVKILDIKLFPQTEIEVLNGLTGYRKMYDEMQGLTRKKIPYHFVHIHLSNIPQINEKYGRDIGDLMMGEYIKKLRYNFIKDNQSLFRIGGINFGLIIKDEKKYEILVRALQGTGELLNLKMVFGGITQTVYPNIGISESPYLGKSPDKVIEEAAKALEISIQDTTHKNYCFFDKC
jgi:GGDEF domain-containing protein